ncbi:MAG: GIY-YIG nuclease family protein [Cyanobacteria bacterium]|nr:GIY-YIG nuclease family protein [Cyanobacteria bacterium CG_2015-16_32_12]NCO79651.1 GIY-YIG nuclease family protein [Cyanobacteria bacterium CG_2015-22_32_23]
MIDIKKLSSVGLNNLDGLPVYSGVYLAIDNGLRVWYIGSSGDLRQRLQTHEKLDDFKENGVTKIAFIRVSEKRGGERLTKLSVMIL